MPPSGGCSLERLSACLPAALTVLVPLCLLLLSRSTRWYSRHRWEGVGEAGGRLRCLCRARKPPGLPCGQRHSSVALRKLQLLPGLSPSPDGRCLSPPQPAAHAACRDQLLICTYVLLACHQALDVPSQLTAAAAVPEGLWRMLGSHVELLWAAALGIVLQVGVCGGGGQQRGRQGAGRHYSCRGWRLGQAAPGDATAGQASGL